LTTGEHDAFGQIRESATERFRLHWDLHCGRGSVSLQLSQLIGEFPFPPALSIDILAFGHALQLSDEIQPVDRKRNSRIRNRRNFSAGKLPGADPLRTRVRR
jgi:hypothetical protein